MRANSGVGGGSNGHRLHWQRAQAKHRFGTTRAHRVWCLTRVRWSCAGVMLKWREPDALCWFKKLRTHPASTCLGTTCTAIYCRQCPQVLAARSANGRGLRGTGIWLTVSAVCRMSLGVTHIPWPGPKPWPSAWRSIPPTWIAPSAVPSSRHNLAAFMAAGSPLNWSARSRASWAAKLGERGAGGAGGASAAGGANHGPVVNATPQLNGASKTSRWQATRLLAHAHCPAVCRPPLTATRCTAWWAASRRR